MLADTEFKILLDLFDSTTGLGGLFDNRSVLSGIMRKLLVVLLDHCDRDVLVFGGSAFELHDTVEDGARTQKRCKRTRTPHLGGESSSRFSD